MNKIRCTDSTCKNFLKQVEFFRTELNDIVRKLAQQKNITRSSALNLIELREAIHENVDYMASFPERRDFQMLIKKYKEFLPKINFVLISISNFLAEQLQYNGVSSCGHFDDEEYDDEFSD